MSPTIASTKFAAILRKHGFKPASVFASSAGFSVTYQADDGQLGKAREVLARIATTLRTVETDGETKIVGTW